MQNEIFDVVIEIDRIKQEAYEIYLPIVDDLCSRAVSEEEVSHYLDYLLDFADNQKMLGLYKKLCRRYVSIYPECVFFYVKAYQEMWGDVEEEEIW